MRYRPIMHPHKTKTIALIDHDQSLAESLRALFRDEQGFRLSMVCASSEEFQVNLRAHSEEPDIALIDLSLPGESGQELINWLSREHPEIKSIVYTNSEDQKTVLSALRVGAAGYLLKGGTGPVLVESLKTLEQGGAPLTPRIARLLVEEFQPGNHNPLTDREQRVLDLLSQGLSYKACAAKLTLSVHTIHDHVKKIYIKLEVHSKREAIKKATQKGWLSESL